MLFLPSSDVYCMVTCSFVKTDKVVKATVYETSLKHHVSVRLKKLVLRGALLGHV